MSHAPIPRNNRTRVGTGASLYWAAAPAGSMMARRFRELYYTIISDIGGDTAVSEAQKQIARRLAQLSVLCEGIEANLAAGLSADVASYVTYSNALRRMAESIGIKRQPLDVTPSHHQLIQAKANPPSKTKRRRL